MYVGVCVCVERRLRGLYPSLYGNITTFTRLPHKDGIRHGDKHQGFHREAEGVSLAWCFFVRK